MTISLQQTLLEHARQRDLISISRDEIDPADLYGFVLAASTELVVLQHEYEFRLDGLRVLRLADITDVRCTATNQFQAALMATEGLRPALASDHTFDLTDWRTIIGQLARDHALLILECEAPDAAHPFSIGRARTVSDTVVVFDSFDGVGKWQAVPDEIDLSEITMCQVDTNYIRFYERHFARQALS